MKKVLWFAAGIAVGAIAAHQFGQTATGKRVFADFDARVKEFTDALVDGYHEREAELRAAIGDAGDTVKKAARK
ncbi:hypothetical protein BH09ACT6_BH09ACT6_16780 [soil metagenome]